MRDMGETQTDRQIWEKRTQEKKYLFPLYAVITRTQRLLHCLVSFNMYLSEKQENTYMHSVYYESGMPFYTFSENTVTIPFSTHISKLLHMHPSPPPPHPLFFFFFSFFCPPPPKKNLIKYTTITKVTC